MTRIPQGGVLPLEPPECLLPFARFNFLSGLFRIYDPRPEVQDAGSNPLLAAGR